MFHTCVFSLYIVEGFRTKIKSKKPFDKDEHGRAAMLILVEWLFTLLAG